MPFDDGFDRLLEDQSRQADAFSDEIRRRMQEAMQEIERDFAAFLDHLLRVEVAGFEHRVSVILDAQPVNTAESVTSGIGSAIQEVFGFDSGSLIGRSLGAALDRAVSDFTRTGKVRPRSLLRAGAAAASNNITRTSGSGNTGGLRFSRSQAALEIAGELQKGGRNG